MLHNRFCVLKHYRACAPIYRTGLGLYLHLHADANINVKLHMCVYVFECVGAYVGSPRFHYKQYECIVISKTTNVESQHIWFKI